MATVLDQPTAPSVPWLTPSAGWQMWQEKAILRLNSTNRRVIDAHESRSF